MSTAWIDPLRLRTLDPDRQASVALASIPLPAHDHGVVVLKDMASQAVPVAWYPGDHGPGLARQVLVMGIAGTPGRPATLSDELYLAPAHGIAVVDPRMPTSAPVSDAAWTGPSWQSYIIEEKKTGLAMREVNELALEYQGRRMGIRMGIEMFKGDFRGFTWWEWLRIEKLWAGPVCTAIRAAGYIGITPLTEEAIFGGQRFGSGDWFHHHNWLYAELYAQVFVNGLVRVTARHVNNRFFDQGRDLEGFVPVIAFNTLGAPGIVPGITQTGTSLDGSSTDLSLGRVQLDIDRSADLMSPQHPARIRSEGGLVIYQPYEGAELLLGEHEPADRWNVKAEELRMWKGMARSFGFDLSFADQPIRTRRYLPPYGFMAYAGALWPGTNLAARGPLESICDKVIDRSIHYGRSLGVKPFCSGRYFQGSCTWDGELAHAFMLQTYRTGRRDLYEAAIHHAYAFADVGINHADFTHQMALMPKGSMAIPLYRNLGMLAAYLETGDPYLLFCAESLTDAAYAIDRGNWPRRSYGRDSSYIRGLLRLYDVTGQIFYLQRAGEACSHAAQCQRDDGSFSDQGGANGAHGHLNEATQPWMNSILAEVFVDYLQRAGNDPVIEASLIKIADWLLDTLLEDENGQYWPAQTAWGRNVSDPSTKFGPVPGKVMFPAGYAQLDYNARTFLWISQVTGDPKYARAWQATFQRHYNKLKRKTSVYGNVKVAENFPWHEAHLWGARWDGQKVTFQPMLALIELGREAMIELPNGQTMRVRRTGTGVETSQF